MVTASRRCDFALLVSVSMPSPCTSQSLGILVFNSDTRIAVARRRRVSRVSVCGCGSGYTAQTISTANSICTYCLTKIVRVSSP